MNFLIVARDIMDEPWILTEIIAKILGFFINIFFYVIYDLIGIEYCSLGLAIILLTIFARFLMTPIAYKQQKSMYKMQLLQPELKKIQDKYQDAKDDPELQRKMSMETQKLYSENNVNPLSGCLPLVIQLPIFFGLYYVMQNPFLYISNISEIFSNMSEIILNVAEQNSGLAELIFEFGNKLKVPAGTEYTVDIVSRMINCLGPTEMDQINKYISDPHFAELFTQKTNIETFIGINLTETVGYALTPKLIIPVLSGLTTFLSSWIMSRKNTNTDPAMKSQQRIMNITMPIMMAWITISLPAGIGLYWITSNIYQLIQQIILNKHFAAKADTEEMKVVIPKAEKPKKKKKNKNHEQYPRQYR